MIAELIATRARSNAHAGRPQRRDHVLPPLRLGPARRLDGAGASITFADELGSVTLTPDTTGGVFEVRVDGALIWSRKEAERFPEITELKRLVRDRIAPGRSLGHVDKG